MYKCVKFIELFKRGTHRREHAVLFFHKHLLRFRRIKDQNLSLSLLLSLSRGEEKQMRESTIYIYIFEEKEKRRETKPNITQSKSGSVRKENKSFSCHGQWTSVFYNTVINVHVFLWTVIFDFKCDIYFCQKKFSVALDLPIIWVGIFFYKVEKIKRN